jgi:hypothetical protein
MKRIKTTEVEYKSSDSDAGLCFTIICPACKEKITCGEYAWWNQKCKCGYEWHVEVVAIGTKTGE